MQEIIKSPLFEHHPKLKQVSLWIAVIGPALAPLPTIWIAYFTMKHPEQAALFKQIGLIDYLQKLPFMIGGSLTAWILKEGYVDGKKAEATGRQAAAQLAGPTVAVLPSAPVPQIDPPPSDPAPINPTQEVLGS